jgi:hypothetical protein
MLVVEGVVAFRSFRSRPRPPVFGGVVIVDCGLALWHGKAGCVRC